MQYLAYSNPPTSVSEAHKADFLVPGVDALVQIKSNRIEVHTLESTGLRLAVHGSIQGTVLRSVPVRLRGVPTCALAILTTDYILCVVAFQHSQPVSDSNASSGEYRIITLASQSVLERSASPAVDIVALLASDDDAAAAAAQPTRFLLIHAFQGLIRVIVLDDGEEQQLSAVQKPDKRRASRGAVASKDGETSVDLARGFTTRIPELLLTSLLILPRSASTSPHRLATIHTDRHGDRLLLLRNINLQTKALEFEEDASSAATSASPPFVPKTGLLLSDPDSEMMIPIQVHDKVQGIIIVGQDCTRFVHTGHVRRASVSSASMDIISEKSTMAESGVSSMSLEEEAMTGTQAPTSPTVSSAISKGKGKAKEVASPTLVAQTGAAGAGTAARRRSSAASQQPLATSPTSTLGMADPRAGYKRKLSESANSSGRGKATARVGADVVPNGKSIECSLPISQYVAHCTLDEDPNRFLLADSWGNVILLRLSVERSPPVRRSSVTQASPTTTTVPLASSPPSPSKAAMSPTSPAARPRPASRSSISSGSATDKLTTVKLSVEKVEAGKVSSPTALVNLGSNYIFVGSHLGDSLLVRLSPSAGPGEQDGGDMDIDSAPVKNGSTKDGGMELEILNAYTNLAPIVDFCVVETGDGKGPSHMVTCSGGKDDGTLRVIRHGVGMTDLASMDMEGVQRVWTINSGNVDEGCHDLLVLSHINETRILSFSGEAGSDDTSIEELDGLGSFRLSSPTLLAHSHASQIYQVTADAVIGPTSAWSSGDGKKITLAAACEDFMLVALAGGVIALLRLGSAGKAEELGRQNLGNEVACLDVSRLRLANGSGIIAAAGLWNVYSVVTLSVPDLEVHETIKLDTTFLLRSVLSCTLSTEEERTPTSYLFIGLGDGTLVSYSYATSRNEGGLPRISESSRKNLALGNRPITLAKIATGAISAENDGPAPQASPAVLVASDRATIVSYANGKLSYSSANLSSTVSSVAAFNHLPAYASSLVICSQDQIQIGRVDELQKLHVKTLRLGDEAPRRIAHARTLKAYGVVFLKELLDSKTGELSRSSSFKLLDDSTFDVLADFPLERNEEARSVACLTLGGMEDDGASMAERFVVGTGFIEPDAEESKRGRVLVFEHAGEGSYRQVGEAETRGAVHAIAGLPDGKFAVTSNSEIIVYDWNASGELEYLTNWGASFIAYSLVSKGDLLCAVDPLRSVSLLRFDASTSKLIDIAKEFSAYGVFVAAFLEDASQSGEGASTGTETILAADLDLNLFTSKRMKATSVMTGSAAMSSANSRTADVETLKSQARIHVGEVVNKICKGSLVPSFSQTTTGAVPQVVFCTSVGSIGTVTTLSANTSSILSSVERNMRKVVPSVGHLKQSDYRAFKTEYHTDPAVGFIDGAFVEELLELSSEDVDRVMAGGSEHEKIIDASKEDVIRLIEELQRMH